MSNSAIKIREVKSRRDLKQFIKLPYKIHKGHDEWLPPIYEDEWKLYDPEKNPAFDHCETILLLAYKEGKVVGRVMGIINRVYNDSNNEQDVRFCFMETYKDKAVFDRLMGEVERWGREKGMEGIVGPIGFSDKDPQGFLIEGFNDPMTVLITNHSYEYMVEFMESSGFSKKLDLVQYRLPIYQALPEIYNRIADRVLSKGKYTVREFKKTRQIKKYISAVFALINDTYQHIYGFAPLTDREAHEFANRFLPILDANFIKLIFDEKEELVAFVIGMPDLSKGLRTSGGRLFPFGFIPVLISMRRTKQLNLMLGCIRESSRGRGLDTVLAVKLFRSATTAGYNMLDTQLVMETNKPMRAEYERLNAEMYKKYRIYHKKLGTN